MTGLALSLLALLLIAAIPIYLFARLVAALVYLITGKGTYR